ncbi:GABA-specific permease [Acrodontium crateriforme]|uniref:GABA-specific permease n=1 Tax=Acrodontium crateriforme TaxID=150365 RepID=A0AAQ3M0W8_9PEZI|nr:GABA-specific permease [Acrodontium crateriforme]
MDHEGESQELTSFTQMLADGGTDRDTQSVIQDDRDMYRMGNTQELQRNFHTLSILGLTCVVLTTWTAILASSTFSLINGGRAGSIYVYIGTWICTLPVTASLAEMASMAPTAGGQYHWVSEFSPPAFQRPLSYTAAWLAALGWQTFIAASAYGAAVLILLMASVGHSTYVPQPWHETLLTIFIGFCSLLFNVFGAKRLPLFEGVVLVLYILGFFVIVIPLWVLADKVPIRHIFTDFGNFGGWPSTGIACIVGQTAATTAFIGVDCATHMAEEVRKASRAVPRMMILTIMVNGTLGFVMLVTYISVIQDVEKQIVDSKSPYPLIGVFVDATNYIGGICMTVPIAVMSFFGCINAIMAASRQVWSFSRDDGMPFSSWWKKVVSVEGTPIPLNSMIGSLAILIVIALLNLASSEVVNSVFGLIGASVGMNYIMSISCVLWRRLCGESLPDSPFKLGRWGIPINAFAVAFQTFSTVISFFPLFSRPTGRNMNWSIAILSGVALIGILNYFTFARGKYRGPVTRVRKHS